MTTTTQITYSYLDAGSGETGTWVGDVQRAVDRAREALDDSRVIDDGDIAYYAPEGDGTRWYRVTRDEAAELGAALIDGHHMAEVYSLWCAGAGSPMSPEECQAAGIEIDE